MDLKVALAQIKTVTADLEDNTRRILTDIQKAKDENVDIIVFHELAISDYNCGVLFQQKHFIENQLRFLNEIIVPAIDTDLVCVIGFIDLIGNRKDGTPDITNSVAIIQNGKIIGKSSKILLANGSHHEDKKYFTPGTIASVTTVNIKGKLITIGTPICEDCWSSFHQRDVVSEYVQNGAEIIITINKSYFSYGKQETRRKMYMQHARKHNVPVISVNNIGVGDIGGRNFMIYDGGSMVISEDGYPIAEAQRFVEDFLVVDMDFKKAYYKPKKWSKYEEIYEALVFATKHIFKDIGLTKGQIHMSGGIDSSLVLPIVVEALGKENVIAISNPSKYNGNVTKSNAQQICDTLGVKLYWNSIQKIQESFIESHKEAFGEDSVKSLCITSFDAVGRTVQGLAASHTFNTGIIATGNHTEIVLGWSSFHDIGSIGVMSLIGDLTKVEVFELSKYINQLYGKEIIPYNLYNGSTVPSAELSDSSADPFDYYIVSGICAEIIREMKDIVQLCEEYKSRTLNPDYFPKNTEGKDIYDIVNFEQFSEQVIMCFKRSKASVFKTSQAAGIVIVSPVSRGFSNRETIINKYECIYDFKKIKSETIDSESI